MATSNDYFTEVGTPGSATTLATPGHIVGSTTFKVVSTAGFPAPGKSVIFAVDTFTTQTVGGVSTQVRTANSYSEWEAVVTDATTLTNAIIRYGTDQPYPFDGSCRVYIPVASSRENRLAQGIQVHANQDGTLLPAAVQTAIGAAGITNTNLATGIDASKLFIPYKFLVYRSTNFTNVDANPTPFDTKVYDTGSNYSTSSFKFTAPVAGFYTFSAAAVASYSSSGNFEGIYLQKNGTDYLSGGEFVVTYAGGSTNEGCTITTPPIQLAVNDTTNIRFAVGAVGVIGSAAPYQTWFGGQIVSGT